ncbi:fimbrial biogenesis chaperone [Enterobacter mori]|uniref:fimbrial biogenesis chaperone n=1 Tax=Enterobacter mori TaxID=539813 RepID=UPI002016410C|nr:fimbria/pilus periplasmic chaperone [Enterobacter mori]
MKKMITPWICAFLCAIAMAASCIGDATANVVITGTRVIYPQQEREVTVRLDNKGELPALVQTWVDKGDPNAQINKLEVPFVLMPAVFRVEPGKGQTLRLSYTGEPLPQDRESVFWLNVLDIPPKTAAVEGENLLQMAIRSRIKLFFRPATLNAEGAMDAIGNTRWHMTDATTLRGENPSPYHVNIAAVTLKTNGKSISTKAGGMLAPHSSATFRLERPVSSSSNNVELTINAINDFGGVTAAKGALSAR